MLPCRLDATRIGLQQVVDTPAAWLQQPGYSVSFRPTTSRACSPSPLFARDPRHDATLHLDQYSGQVLADIRLGRRWPGGAWR